MSDENQIILDSPVYQELLRKRARFSWLLTAAVLLLYFGFIGLIAAEPHLGLLGTRLSATTKMTVGLPVGIGIILSSIALTGVYVHRANTQFDRLVARLIDGAK